MGRPTKRTPGRWATLMRAPRHGASYNATARAAWISPALFRQWRSDDPRLAAEAEAARWAAAEEWSARHASSSPGVRQR